LLIRLFAYKLESRFSTLSLLNKVSVFFTPLFPVEKRKGELSHID